MTNLWMTCEHGRLRDGCEDCALVAAMERGQRLGAPFTAAARPEPELADADTHIDRGGGVYMFVRAGDEIPAALSHLPRVPREGPAEGKQAGPGMTGTARRP